MQVSLTVSPVRDATGTIVGASKVARDITERERQEQALREANAALIQSNADLQQFAYSASHDLQEPLRMVATYSEMLRRRFGGSSGQNGDEYIGYIIQGALRMEQLLKDLRAYAQASIGAQEPAGTADADKILDNTLESLDAAIKECGACITREPASLPSAYTISSWSSSFRTWWRIRFDTAAACAANSYCRHAAGSGVAILGRGQWHRHRSRIQGADFWDIQASAQLGGVSRHRYGPGDLPEDCRALRRAHLGGIRAWPRFDVLLYDSGVEGRRRRMNVGGLPMVEKLRDNPVEEHLAHTWV